MDDFNQLWEKILLIFEPIEVEKMANLLRGIWLRRNELIFKNIFKPPLTVIREAETEWESFHFAKDSCTKLYQPRIAIKWSPPLAHRLKN